MFIVDTWLQGAVLVLGALLIGIAKAGFGGGPGMLVPPLLALFIDDTKIAIGLLLPLLLATDIFALRFYWRRWDKRNVVPILAGAAIGICIGAKLLAQLDPNQLRKAIGVLAIVLGGTQILRQRLVPSTKVMKPIPWLGVAAGVVCGIGSTLAHQGGVPVTLYLLPQQLDAASFVGTTTAIFFFVNAAKLAPFVDQNMIPKEALITDLCLLPVIYLGTVIGVRLNKVVPKEWFLRVVLWFVLLAGIMLLLRS